MKLLTLDLGTTALKVALWSDGRLIAERAAIIELQVQGLRAEQDATNWWAQAVALVRELAPTDVDGIGVTAQMHAVVPIDASGTPLAPVPIVMDRRARAEVAELSAKPGWRTIHAITGGRLDVTCVLPKLRHLARDPAVDAWRKARWLLPPKDFLRFRLTGEAATDPIDAAGTLLWNLRKGEWEPDLVELAGVRISEGAAVVEGTELRHSEFCRERGQFLTEPQNHRVVAIPTGLLGTVESLKPDCVAHPEYSLASLTSAEQQA